MSVEFRFVKNGPQLGLLAVAGLAIFGTQYLESQIVIKGNGREVRVNNPATEVKAAPLMPVLKWNNGESVSGEIVSATPDEITWKTSLFTAPLILRLPYLHSVEIPQPEKEPSEPFAIALRNGDRIYGQLTAIDDKTVTVRSECHGDIVLLRTEVTSLRRLRGKELLYSGPTAGAPWRAISDRNFGPRKRQLWNSAETGRPMMGSWNSINFLPLALPEQVDVTFHVRSTGLPQFRLYLNSNFGASPSIETWDNILVLVHDGHFALLRTLTPEDRDVNLRICWSQKEKRCAVFTMEGEKIAELSTKESVAQDKSLDIPEDGDDPFGGRGRIARQEGKPEAGICLHNTGINLELETLRVREWNGSPPQKIKPDQIRIELADGSVIPGNILHSDAAGILVQKTDGGQKTMPLEGVEAIVLGSDPMLGKHTGTELWFADGTFLSGKLTEIQNGVASLQTLFSVNPIQSKITTLKHINFRVPKSAGDGDEPALAELDRLVLGKDTLHGVPVGGGDALLRWMPVGGVQSIPLASGSDAELIRSIKADSTVTKAPALFFLTNGDILPGELRGMDESMVDIHSSISTLGRVPVANFHAIQFSGPDYNPDGFTDPGWRTLKGDSKSVERNDKGVTIRMGGSFGHSSVLQADELRFNFEAKDGYGALRLKFFVNDFKSTTKPISILLMRTGNEIYCGQDDGRGQFQERGQFSVPMGKAAQIKLALNEANVELFVNDVPLQKIAAPASKREGLGLILDPADVWGNGEREVTVTNFSARLNPERGWFPAIDSEARSQSLLVPRFRRDDLPTHVLVAANGDLLRGHIESVTSAQIKVRSGLESVSVPRKRVTAAIWLLPPDKNAVEKPDTKKPVDKAAVNESSPQAAPLVINGGGNLRVQVNGGGVVVLNGGGVIINGEVVAKDTAETDNEDAGAGPGETKTKPAVVEAPNNTGDETPGFTPTHWLQLRDGGRIALMVDRFDADRLTGHSPLLGTCEIPLDRIHVIRFRSPEPTAAMLAYKQWRLQLAPEPVIPGTGGQSSPLLGNVAKDFRLPLLGGGDFVLGNEKGKVVVLDFWATWCGPCVQSLPGMMETMSKFDSTRVKFIGVNQGEGAAQVQRFLEQRGWKLNVALDTTQSVAKQFGVEGIPHTVIIGPDGKIAWINTGYRPGADKDAADAVSKLLEGQGSN